MYLMRWSCYFNRRMGSLIRPETSPNAPQLTEPPYTEAGIHGEIVLSVEADYTVHFVNIQIH